MRHITVGRKYNEGKVAKIECVKNDRLQNIDIKDKCFLLIILTAGKLEFNVENERLYAAAPALTKPPTPCLFQSKKRSIPVFTFIPNF